MKRWLTTYGVALGIFGVLDAAWILLVARRLYASRIPHLMGSDVAALPAGAFYLAFVGGLVHFAVHPGRDRDEGVVIRDAAIYGALAYAAWGLTGAAVLKDFPLTVALSDIGWGAAASAVTALVTRRLMRRLAPPTEAH